MSEEPITRRERQERRQSEEFGTGPHRMLPSSTDAEQGVLCSLLLSPAEVASLCAERGVQSAFFHVPSHQTLYSTIIAMWMEEKPIDIVTLSQLLHDRKQLEDCGGAAYVSQLFMLLPTASNVGHYLDIVVEKHTLREVIRVGTEAATRAYDEQDDVEGIVEDFERKALAVRPKPRSTGFCTSKQATMEAMQLIAECYENRGKIGGLATGLRALDKLINGLQKAEMIVLAARPSMGKTALAMGIAEYIAVEQQRPVGVFSLEMSQRQLMQRMICSRAKVNLTAVREGFTTKGDSTRLMEAASVISDSPMYFDDASDLTIQEIRAKARRMHKDHAVEAIFIDYLQLVRSTSKQARDKREREVAEVSAGCKAMAKELDIPVIVLAQLSRDLERRGPESKPRLSDLRDSGSIEQDADTIAFITREEFYAETEEEMREAEGKAELFIAKQRMGPRGTIPLTFLKEITRFQDRHDGEEPDDAQVPLL